MQAKHLYMEDNKTMKNFNRKQVLRAWEQCGPSISVVPAGRRDREEGEGGITATVDTYTPAEPISSTSGVVWKERDMCLLPRKLSWRGSPKALCHL